MDDPDSDITVSEVPPHRQSSGLAYFKRIQERSESYISETSSFNLLIDESPPVSPKYTQATIDDWLQPQKELCFKSDDSVPELNVFSVLATANDSDDLFLGPSETDSEATQLYCDDEDLLRLLPPTTLKKHEDLEITQLYCDENLFSLPTSPINNPMNSQATHLYYDDEESLWLPLSPIMQQLNSQEAQLYHLDYADEIESSPRPLSSTRQHEIEEVEADYIEEFTPSPLPSYNSLLLQQLDEDPIEDFSPSPSPKRVYSIEDDPIEPYYDLSVKSRKTNGLDVAHSKLDENSPPKLHQIVRPATRELRTSRIKKPVTISDYFVLPSQEISSGEPEIIGRESIAPSYYQNNEKNAEKGKSIDIRKRPIIGLSKNISK